MSNAELQPLSDEELAAEGGTALPDKEVISLLDLNADLDLGLDAAAPIDLAVAANANVAAPIDAAVGANVLSVGSQAQALSDQGVSIDQGLTGEAVAEGNQDSAIDQGADPTGGDVATDGATAGTTDGATAGTTDPATSVDATDPSNTGSVLDGDLLDVNVDVATDLNLAAPIGGAVAANANVAAPIDGAVAANVASVDSDAVAVAQQDAIINQDINADASATTNQTSDINQ
jgi:hypothetical protein